MKSLDLLVVDVNLYIALFNAKMYFINNHELTSQISCMQALYKLINELLK